MKKRDRVFAAIRGEEVDHVPCGFSLHFPHDRAFGVLRWKLICVFQRNGYGYY